MAMECSVGIVVCSMSGWRSSEREDDRYLNLILSVWTNNNDAGLPDGRRRCGHGGIQQVAEITGLHPETIASVEMNENEDSEGRRTDRVRLRGGGRPCLEKKILPPEDLARLVEPEPPAPLPRENGCGRGCAVCRKHGHRACPTTIGRLLRSKATVYAAIASAAHRQPHAERDHSFIHCRQREEFRRSGRPRIA